jgi:hypothetical protein
MFYVLTSSFHLIRIQNLYQIVGLDETYKIEVMKVIGKASYTWPPVVATPRKILYYCLKPIHFGR